MFVKCTILSLLYVCFNKRVTFSQLSLKCALHVDNNFSIWKSSVTRPLISVKQIWLNTDVLVEPTVTCYVLVADKLHDFPNSSFAILLRKENVLKDS